MDSQYVCGANSSFILCHRLEYYSNSVNYSWANSLFGNNYFVQALGENEQSLFAYDLEMHYSYFI